MGSPDPRQSPGSGLGRGRDREGLGWVLGRGLLSPHAGPVLGGGRGAACGTRLGWAGGQLSSEHLPQSSAAFADTLLYERINPVNKSSAPRRWEPSCPAGRRTSAGPCVPGRAEGLRVIFPRRCAVPSCPTMEPLRGAAGQRRAAASRGGGGCLQSDSLCLKRLRNSSGEESHSFLASFSSIFQAVTAWQVCSCSVKI